MADYDGDLDVVITHHDAPAVVLWNETPEPGHAVLLRLRSTGGNRDAIGAIITSRVEDRTIVQTIDGGGYLSAHDPRVHLGIGPSSTIGHIKIRWPDGAVEARHAVPAGSVVDFVEP